MRTIPILAAALVLASMAFVPTGLADHETEDCSHSSVATANGAENLWINQRFIQDNETYGDEGLLYAEGNGLTGLQTVNTTNCGHGPDIRVDESPQEAVEALLNPVPVPDAPAP